MKNALAIYLFTVFFILAMVADLLPFFKVITHILNLNKSSFQIIRSAVIEDSKKEKLLLANSFSIFKQSIKITTLLLLVLVCGCLLFLLSGIFNFMGYRLLLDYLKTINGIILSITSFLSYFIFKKIYAKVRL